MAPPYGPYSMLGLDALNPYAAQMLGVGGANRGLQSSHVDQALGANLTTMPHPGFNPAMFQHPGFNPFQHPGFNPFQHPGAGGNPILQQLINRQAAMHYPHMAAQQPARKSGNSLGINGAIPLNSTVGYNSLTFPTNGVPVTVSTTLQSDFHGLKMMASASFVANVTPSQGVPMTTYAQQPGGVASDCVLLGSFVGGFNTQPVAPGTTIGEGAVALSSFPPNGIGNGIDILPGKIGQKIQMQVLVLPSVLSLFQTQIDAGSTVLVMTANIFITLFGDNLQ